MDIHRGSRGVKRLWSNLKHEFSGLSTLRIQHLTKRGQRYYTYYYSLVAFH